MPAQLVEAYWGRPSRPSASLLALTLHLRLLDIMAPCSLPKLARTRVLSSKATDPLVR